MLILTGFNSSMLSCGTLCVRSIERYLTRHREFHFTVEAIPEDYDRPPSWHKVQSLLKHLPDHDFVLWTDADTIMMGNLNLRSILEDKTLNIARDKYGVNHGVAAWKNCPEAFWALETMNRGFESHSDHPWFEQSVLMEIESQIQIGYQPKHIWNAYPDDLHKDTQILHFPGISNRDRLPLMQQAYNKLIA